MFEFLTFDYFSLLLPLAYLTTLIGSLGTFSYLYRRRQALKAASLEPWFPPHLQRNIYLSLLELSSSAPTTEPSSSTEVATVGSKQKIPDSLLRAALLRRAQEDIQRIITLRTSKPAIQALLQRGSVSDELWQRFQLAEKEMEAELREVVEEANALSAGPVQWGQYIFNSASEIVGREMLDKQLEKVEESRQEEKEAWERRRESVRNGFMKELEEGIEKTSRKESVAAIAEKVEESKDASRTSSEDADTVMVEGGGPADPAPPTPAKTAPSTPASSKKKKGKK
jgi:translocation protein SEC66